MVLKVSKQLKTDLKIQTNLREKYAMKFGKQQKQNLCCCIRTKEIKDFEGGGGRRGGGSGLGWRRGEAGVR